MIRLRKIALPGFKGMGLYDVIRFFIKNVSDTRFTLAASGMAFNFFFSFFPTLLLLVLAISWLPDAGLDEYLNQFLQEILPAETLSMVEIDKIVDVKNVRRALKRSVDPNRGSSIFFIVLILILALRGALRGIITMTQAFTKNEEAFKRRTLIQTYSTALIIFMVLGGLFLFSVLVLIFGKWIVSYLVHQDIISRGLDVFLINTFNYIISLALLTLSVSTIYYLAPATHQRWKFITPGSILASFLILITVLGFGWFFSNLNNFKTIYGSLAAIILFMLWFYYLSLVLLVGFELNAAIDQASLHKEMKLAKRKVSTKEKEVPELVVAQEVVEAEVPAVPPPESPSSPIEDAID